MSQGAINLTINSNNNNNNNNSSSNNDDFELPPLAGLSLDYQCSEFTNKCKKCSEEIKRLNNIIMQKEEEIATIKAKHVAHTDTIAELFIDSLNKQAKVVEQKEKQIKILEKEKEELNERIKQLEQHHETQTKQIETLQYEKNNLVSSVIQLQKDNRDLTAKYGTLKTEHATLNDKYNYILADNSAIHKDIKEIRESITSPITSQQNSELSVYVYISDLSKIYLRYILMAKLRETDAVKYKDSEWVTFSCEYTDDTLADQVSWDTYKIDLARIYDFNELRNETVHPTKLTKAAISNTIDKINDREEELNQMELWNANTTQEKKEELREAYKYLTNSIIKACETYQPPTPPKNRSYKKF